MLFRPTHVALILMLGAATCSTTPPLQAQVTGVITTLHSFGTADVPSVNPGVFQGLDGTFFLATFGTTTDNRGIVYRFSAEGAQQPIYTVPYSSSEITSFIQGSDGNFYGTMFGDGANDHGIVFQLTLGGQFTTLAQFTGGSDGENPYGLLQARDGNFYGTTAYGGTKGDGTIFMMTPAGAVATLYDFNGHHPPGYAPMAQMVEGTDGNFYGITVGVGGTSLPAIFKITPTGKITSLHNFTQGIGQNPLIQGVDGNFYGSTDDDGPAYQGTLYKITPEGQFSTLHTFTGGSDGGVPTGGLLQGRDGNFYGTTDLGGSGKDGTVFMLTPAGALTTLYNFSGRGDGGFPNRLIQTEDGTFYGTTASTLFKLVVQPAFFTGAGAVGSGVYYLGFPGGNFFGYYTLLNDPSLLFHFDLGYEAVFNANDAQDGIYLYDFATGGYFYTSPTFPFPYLYDFSLDSVVYYYPDPSRRGRYNTNGTRYFYVFRTGEIITK